MGETGETLPKRTRETRRLQCPCGRSLVQARHPGGKPVVPRRLEPHGEAQPLRHAFECAGCGARYYSLEWRPVGDGECCRGFFHGYRSRSRWPWRARGDGIFVRLMEETCPRCGATYRWKEQIAVHERE